MAVTAIDLVVRSGGPHDVFGLDDFGIGIHREIAEPMSSNSMRGW